MPRRAPTVSHEPLRAILPSALQPVDGVGLTRIGPVGDGGYVVADDVLPASRWLLSLGVGVDWRFERDFSELTGNPVIAYDHTLTERRLLRYTTGRLLRWRPVARPADPLRLNRESGVVRYRRFFRGPHCHRRIAVGAGGDAWSLARMLAQAPQQPLFLKMDVEGAEWSTVADLVAAQEQIVGAAIEFHDVPNRLSQLLGFLAATPSWAVVATSANNAAGLADDGVPNVIEVSFARRDLLEPRQPPTGRRSDPGTPNTALAPPIDLGFAASRDRPAQPSVIPPAARAVLCLPRRCGLNDILVQVAASYATALREQRALFVDTSLSGLWDSLDHYLVPTAATLAGPVPVHCRVTVADLARWDADTVSPGHLQGRLSDLYRETRLRMIDSGDTPRAVRATAFAARALRGDQTADLALRQRLRFVAATAGRARRNPNIAGAGDSAAALVVQHRSGGGEQSFAALRLFTLSPGVRRAVAAARQHCGPDYDAIHIRNTDLPGDYDDLLRRARRELAGRRVLVCSDDAAAVAAARRTLTESEVITVTETEHTAGAALHKVGARRPVAERRRLATDQFVDLLCLASATTLRVAPARGGGLSGYSRLAQLLAADPALRRQLAGDTR